MQQTSSTKLPCLDEECYMCTLVVHLCREHQLPVNSSSQSKAFSLMLSLFCVRLQTVILDRTAAHAATKDIMTVHCIPKDRSADLLPETNGIQTADVPTAS